jgi:hypothetical protein
MISPLACSSFGGRDGSLCAAPQCSVTWWTGAASCSATALLRFGCARTSDTQRLQTLVLQRRCAGEQLVEHYAQGVNVAAGSMS